MDRRCSTYTCRPLYAKQTYAALYAMILVDVARGADYLA